MAVRCYEEMISSMVCGLNEAAINSSPGCGKTFATFGTVKEAKELSTYVPSRPAYAAYVIIF